MSRSKTVALLLLALICLSIETVNACSPVPVAMKVRCDGKQETLFFDYRQSGEKWAVNRAELASLGKQVCGSDIPVNSPRIAEIVTGYNENFSYFSTSDLEFTLYRPDLLTELETQNLNLLTCRTNFIEVVEDWIIHYEHRPNYCGNEPFVLTVCGSGTRIMLLPFLSYLYRNPSAINQLYLAGILLITFVVGWLLWRQRSFFTPTVGKAFLFLLICPSLLYVTVENGFSLDIGTLGWAAMVWILVSAVARLLGYLKTLFRLRETPV